MNNVAIPIIPIPIPPKTNTVATPNSLAKYPEARMPITEGKVLRLKNTEKTRPKTSAAIFRCITAINNVLYIA